MNKKAKWLVWGMFIVLFGLFTTGDIRLFLLDPDLNKDSNAVTATIYDAKHETVERKVKKIRMNVEEYTFSYKFIADSKEYKGAFVATDEDALPYLALRKAELLYKIADPNIHALKTRVKEHSISRLLWEIVKGFLITGLISLIVGSYIASKLGWITKTDSADEDEASDKKPEAAA